MKISVLTPTIRPDGLEPVADSLLAQTMPQEDFEWLVEISDGKTHDLNAAYNRMLGSAEGRLVVSVQDWTKLPENALEALWEAHISRPETFFTCPVGKVDEWGDEPRWDWRTEREKVTWMEWEIDFGAAPFRALREIGGFDEEMDGKWSYDNVNVGLRAHLAGYDFACLPDLRAVAWDHDKHIEHPFRGQEDLTFHNMRLDEFRRGLKIDYVV